MKYFIAFGLIAFGLTACGINQGVDFKIFDSVNATELVKQSKPISCSNTIEFRGISFEQKCWQYIANTNEDVGVFGEFGMVVGLAIQKNGEMKFEEVEKPKSGYITLRQKTEDKCAHYIVVTFDDEMLPEGKANQKLEFGLAVSRKAYCGTVVKGYSS